MRILVVVLDRDPTQLETICRGLLVCGHLPYPARTLEGARAALTARGARRLDLLLTDASAPDRCHAALVELVGTIAPWLPVLVITGITDEPALDTLRAIGAPLLLKPFTPDDLDAAVRAATNVPHPCSEDEHPSGGGEHGRDGPDDPGKG